MSVQQVQKGYISGLAVRMLDVSGDPVLSIAYGDITVTYKKQGDTSWTVKVVLSPEWVTGPDGRYFLTFSAAELDTNGRFYFRVAESGSDTFTGDIDVVEDWATLMDVMQDLINGLSTKVPTAAVKTSKKEQDEAVQKLNIIYNQAQVDISRLQAAMAAVKRKLDGLS